MSNSYQPQNTKDALRMIQQLANQYLHAPLTKELLEYNQKQIQYLKQQVIPVAQQQEQNLTRVQQAQTLIQALQFWQQQKLQGKIVTGKIKNYQLTKTSTPKYQHLPGKHHSQPHYRTSHH